MHGFPVTLFFVVDKTTTKSTAKHIHQRGRVVGKRCEVPGPTAQTRPQHGRRARAKLPRYRQRAAVKHGHPQRPGGAEVAAPDRSCSSLRMRAFVAARSGCAPSSPPGAAPSPAPAASGISPEAPAAAWPACGPRCHHWGVPLSLSLSHEAEPAFPKGPAKGRRKWRPETRRGPLSACRWLPTARGCQIPAQSLSLNDFGRLDNNG